VSVKMSQNIFSEVKEENSASGKKKKLCLIQSFVHQGTMPN